MSIIEKIRPQFWHTDTNAGPGKNLFNYRRIWRFAIVLLTVVALVPLLVMAFIDYNVTRHSLESETLLRTARTTSNTRRTVSYFLKERMRALEFLAYQQGVSNLKDPEKLGKTLKSMQKSLADWLISG